MTTIYYVIDLAFPVKSLEDWEHGNDLCHSIIGKLSDSAATGFGFRDMQFHFTSRAERDLAEVRLREQAAHLNFEYISTYTVDEEGYQLDDYGKRVE